MEPHDPSALELSLPDLVFANFGYGKTFILGSRFNANTSHFEGGGAGRNWRPLMGGDVLKVSAIVSRFLGQYSLGCRLCT